MGGGVSKVSQSMRERSVISSARKGSSHPKDKEPGSAPASEGRRESIKQPTSIDARIIATLRQLNLTRRADPKKGRAMHFERIVLQFTLVRDAFTTLRTIYRQFASVSAATMVKRVLDLNSASLYRPKKMDWTSRGSRLHLMPWVLKSKSLTCRRSSTSPIWYGTTH